MSSTIASRILAAIEAKEPSERGYGLRHKDAHKEVTISDLLTDLSPYIQAEVERLFVKADGGPDAWGILHTTGQVDAPFLNADTNVPEGYIAHGPWMPFMVLGSPTGIVTSWRRPLRRT